MSDYSTKELMIIAAAREIKDGERIFVGIGIVEDDKRQFSRRSRRCDGRSYLRGLWSSNRTQVHYRNCDGF